MEQQDEPQVAENPSTAHDRFRPSWGEVIRKVRFLKVTPERPKPTETLKLHQNLTRKSGKHPSSSIIQPI
ncbi:hypothetical protein T265_04711 [Opisthorchis viverrini]|uniref:Uncharacterized protein n=1 Tax=Opisthorchis viverrini TaxID=6198 RepID=A0A074ZM72_OPIVI|nr:hypothetical protein T265_04711 [Opisthorchis viverrini]KER28488.1 hypothetical protein T265_04711 [Opisthorchis viverrini]